MLFYSFSVLVLDHFHRNALFVGLRNTGSSFEPFNALIFYRFMMCLHVIDNFRHFVTANHKNTSIVPVL